jgi:predicted outer membrane repeat protein
VRTAYGQTAVSASLTSSGEITRHIVHMTEPGLGLVADAAPTLTGRCLSFIEGVHCMSSRVHLASAIAMMVGCAILSTATATATQGPMTLHVNGSSGVDTASCGASASPCKTIGQAISNASPGATIDVAAGTYAEHLVIGKQLAIVGAGEEQTIVAATTGHRDVVTVGADGVRLARLSVTGATRARGILNQAGARLTLVHTTVRANGGGGIDNQAGAKLVVVSSTITNNCACRGGSGGGIANAGALKLTHSSVNNNSATLSGGGIYSSGTVMLHRSAVNVNSARDGGGILMTSGSLELRHSSIDDNKAIGNGGGLNVGGGTAKLTKSELLRNQASTGGAIYSAAGTEVVLDQTDVQGNSTPQCVPTSLC